MEQVWLKSTLAPAVHVRSSDMLHYEAQWQTILAKLLVQPVRPTRAGAVRSLFDQDIKWDLREGFPLMTTKPVPLRHVAVELQWFLTGSTNVKYLQERGVKIWDADWRRWGHDDLGPIYGKQWRDFGGVDQIRAVLESLRSDPYGRRHLVSAWNPIDMPKMALPPCHFAFQFYVDEDNGLCLKAFMRSADMFLGVPFNLASYSLLLLLFAKLLGRPAHRITLTMTDCHLYEEHVAQANIVLGRSPMAPPTVVLADDADFGSLENAFTLLNYTPAAPVPAQVLAG